MMVSEDHVSFFHGDGHKVHNCDDNLGQVYLKQALAAKSMSSMIRSTIYSLVSSTNSLLTLNQFMAFKDFVV